MSACAIGSSALGSTTNVSPFTVGNVHPVLCPTPLDPAEHGVEAAAECRANLLRMEAEDRRAALLERLHLLERTQFVYRRLLGWHQNPLAVGSAASSSPIRRRAVPVSQWPRGGGNGDTPIGLAWWQDGFTARSERSARRSVASSSGGITCEYDVEAKRWPRLSGGWASAPGTPV